MGSFRPFRPFHPTSTTRGQLTGRYLELAKTMAPALPSSLIPQEARGGKEGIKGTKGVLPAAVVGAAAQSLPDFAPCPCCQSRRFWRSIHGKTVCAFCHPPAVPQLVAEWIELNGEIAKVGRSS